MSQPHNSSIMITTSKDWASRAAEELEALIQQLTDPLSPGQTFHCPQSELVFPSLFQIADDLIHDKSKPIRPIAELEAERDAKVRQAGITRVELDKKTAASITGKLPNINCRREPESAGGVVRRITGCWKGGSSGTNSLSHSVSLALYSSTTHWTSSTVFGARNTAHAPLSKARGAIIHCCAPVRALKPIFLLPSDKNYHGPRYQGGGMLLCGHWVGSEDGRASEEAPHLVFDSIDSAGKCTTCGRCPLTVTQCALNSEKPLDTEQPRTGCRCLSCVTRGLSQLTDHMHATDYAEPVQQLLEASGDTHSYTFHSLSEPVQNLPLIELAETGQPMWWVHCGDEVERVYCENVCLFFEEVKRPVTSPNTAVSPTQLVLSHGSAFFAYERNPRKIPQCGFCDRAPAELSVVDDLELPATPFFVCKSCYVDFRTVDGVFVDPNPEAWVTEWSSY